MASFEVVLVGNDKEGTISSFRVDEDKLEPLAKSHVGLGCSTFVVDPKRDLVYVATKEPEPAIVTAALDRESGKLTEQSRRTVDAPLAYLDLCGSGVLLGASYHGGWGASWRVRDGVVGHKATRVDHRNMHAAVADRGGQNAYFVSLGEDVIAQFAMGGGGQLVELSRPTVTCPRGSGPRHLVIRPDGRSAYLLTEFSGQAIRLDRDEGGALTPAESIPAFDTKSGLSHSAMGRDPMSEHLIWGADLALADRGRWLLCSERTESTLAAIELAPDGSLTERVVLSSTEEQPRGITVSPDGSRVIVVGERSGCASLYRLEDGSLVNLDRIETGLGPNWVRFVPASGR